MGSAIRRFRNTVDVYFLHDRKTIASENLKRLFASSLFLTGALTLFLILSFLPFTGAEFYPACRFLLAVNVLFLAATGIFRRLDARRYSLITVLTACYVALHLVALVLLSALTLKSGHDFLVQSVILAGPVVFLMVPELLAGMNFLATAAFLMIAFFTKEPSVLFADVCGITVSFVLSCFVQYSLMKMRVSDFYHCVQLSDYSGEEQNPKVYGRRQFADICDNLCEMGAPENGRAILLFKLTDCDALLEDYGARTRDEILRIAGKTVAANAAESDVCGRIATDTFALFLNSVDGESALRHIDVEVRRTIRKNAGKFASRELAVSVGGIFTENEAFSYQEMLEEAESALYTSEIVGRNTVTINRLQKNEYRMDYAAAL